MYFHVQAGLMFLIQVLRRGRCQVSSDLAAVSVRRFASFGLLSTEPQSREEVSDESPNEGDGNHHIWYKYSSPHFPEYSAIIR